MPELFQKFMQLTKVDVAKRLIYGNFTAEVVDKSGEVADYETTKSAITDWSAEISKASGGKSKGNIRKMHGKEVVGKAVEITFDDVNKVISGCVEVNEQTVQEAEKGFLNGFSIGGSYAKKWACPVNKGKTRFTPVIAEISVVDNPCVPDAVFNAIKDAEFAVLNADGATVMRKFAPKQPELELDHTAKAAAEIEAALNKIDPPVPHAPEKKILKLARNDDGTLVKSVLEQVLEFAGVEIEGLEKSDNDALEKITAQRDSLQKLLEGIPAQIEQKFEKLTARIKHLESQPAPDAVQLRTFVKGEEAAPAEKSATPSYLGNASPAAFRDAMNR